MPKVNAVAKKIIANVEKVIIGKRQEVILALMSTFAEGHILLEDVPGVAKTMLARALSVSFGCDFKRVQCTPDLLPSDITGASIFNPKTTEFEFRAGPLFTSILLADEINRTTPRTQAALLEAMAERRVSVDGETYLLDRPFLVIATQNPVDQEGTFPLPEAQLDRFMFKVVVPFLNRGELNEVVSRTILKQPIELPKLLDSERILQLRTTLAKVVVADPIRDYACRLVLATHPDSEFAPASVKEYTRWGASPRAAQGLIKAGRVRALSDGRAHVAFEDIRHFAPEVLQHRVLLNYDGQAENVSVPRLVEDCVANVPEDAAQAVGV